MRRPAYFFLLLLAGVFLWSCDEYDNWTVSPSARLTFSRDTVRFDTVITGQGSPTQTFLVTNANKEGLRIVRVALGRGDASLFRVNVDGQYLAGGVGTDFEVRARDSIYVRAEVSLPQADEDTIRTFEETLVFTLESGRQQEVKLLANGLNVTLLQGETILRDTTLQAGRPYLVRDSLVVAPGATLTLAAGTTLMFHDGVSLVVHGRLKAEGSLQAPVTLRGDRVDRLFPYLPYDNTPNRWGGVHFTAASYGNELVQCDIHSGDYGLRCDSSALDIQKLRVENSVIHNVAGPAVHLTSCQTEFVGTQISNSLEDCLYILGGDHRFTHCTVAQFYPWLADRGHALFLANQSGDVGYPLLRADFVNCVITGYADDVIMGALDAKKRYAEEYLFSHSLLRTVEPAPKDADRFQVIRYDVEDSKDRDKITGKNHFRIFDTTNFLYDFEPDSLSPIRALADAVVAARWPVDRRGNSRLADGNPDAGAYECK